MTKSSHSPLKAASAALFFCPFFPVFLSLPKANKRFFDNFFANCHYLCITAESNPRENPARIRKYSPSKKPKTKGNSIMYESTIVVRVEKKKMSQLKYTWEHNERINPKNTLDLIPELSKYNVLLKECPYESYRDFINAQFDSGRISRRGIGKGSYVCDEIVVNIRSEYTLVNGNFDFSRYLYAVAYDFAKKFYGDENIITAVIHTDEGDFLASFEKGKLVLNIHLHILAIPVVERELAPSERTDGGPSTELVIDHDGKWSTLQNYDEKMNLLPEDQRTVVSKVKPYIVLQDKFAPYMRSHGFLGVVRGEKGNMVEALKRYRSKIFFERRYLLTLQHLRMEEELKYEVINTERLKFDNIMSCFEKTESGYVIAEKDMPAVVEAIEAGVTSCRVIDDCRSLQAENARLTNVVNSLQGELEKAKDKLATFVEAVKQLPANIAMLVGKAVEKVKNKKASKIQSEESRNANAQTDGIYRESEELYKKSVDPNDLGHCVGEANMTELEKRYGPDAPDHANAFTKDAHKNNDYGYLSRFDPVKELKHPDTETGPDFVPTDKLFDASVVNLLKNSDSTPDSVLEALDNFINSDFASTSTFETSNDSRNVPTIPETAENVETDGYFDCFDPYGYDESDEFEQGDDLER